MVGMIRRVRVSRVRKGNLVSPYMFITHLERVMDANKNLKGGMESMESASTV